MGHFSGSTIKNVKSTFCNSVLEIEKWKNGMGKGSGAISQVTSIFVIPLYCSTAKL